MLCRQGRHLQQYFVPKNTTAATPVGSPESSPGSSPAWNSPWGGGAGLNYGSRVGFAAGAAVGIILLICVFILVCDRRRRPYIGHSASQLPLGTRHLYSAQPADTAPKQVQYPVVIINPDNEVECGRKVLFDRTPSAKHDPADYFTSVGPGPPLFAASIPFRQRTMSGPLRSISGPVCAPSGSLLQSFRQRFRPSQDTAQTAGDASHSHGPNHGIVPLHTSDGVVPGGLPGSSSSSNAAASESTAGRTSFRSPFADWNPATGLANDTSEPQRSLELAHARSGARRLQSRENIV